MRSRKLMVAAGLVLAVTGCSGPVAHDPSLPAPTSPVAATTTKPAPRPVVAKTTKPPAKTKAPVTDKRYSTCKEAKAHGLGPYYRGKDPEYHWYTDRDSDGMVCD